MGSNGKYVYNYILITSCIKTHKTSGTVNGAGYDCRNGQVRKFEETDEGIWNMVGLEMEIFQKCACASLHYGKAPKQMFF